VNRTRKLKALQLEARLLRFPGLLGVLRRWRRWALLELLSLVLWLLLPSFARATG